MCVENTKMFLLLLSRTCTVLSAPHMIPPARRLRVLKKLLDDTDGTADPNQPRGYSTPYGIMVCNELREWLVGGLAGHHFSFSFFIFLSVSYFPFHYNILNFNKFYYFISPVSISKSFLFQPTNFLIFSFQVSSPCPAEGEWMSSSVELSCQLGLNHDMKSLNLRGKSK